MPIATGLKAATAAFEKQSGHTVKITFNTTPQIIKRVESGEVFDVVIAPPAAMKQFAQAGKVEDGGVNVGRVVINGERLGGSEPREQYFMGSDFARTLRGPDEVWAAP